MAAKNKKKYGISESELADLRKRAAETHDKLKSKQVDLLTSQEIADAAPFYFELRNFIKLLKKARESASLTLADVSAKTGMAVESLSRLETGAQTNPTWRTLGLYTIAVGKKLRIIVESDDPAKDHPTPNDRIGELQTKILPLPPPSERNAFEPIGVRL